MQNVFAQDIDGTELEAAQFGHEVPRSVNDSPGANYIDYAFDDVTTGAQGQNGIRLALNEFGNLITAMPRNVR